MFDRGTKGWFLRTKIRPRNQGLVRAHGRGQPRTAEKKISGALRHGMRTLSFPTLNHTDQ